MQVSLDKGDRKDRDLHEDLWFELSDETLCNWMMFVRPAQNHLEQNLVAYQYGHHVYYTTIKNVEPKQELKVQSWVSGASARTCGYSMRFHFSPPGSGVLFFSFFKIVFIYLFVGVGREGKREGQKRRCVRETLIGCLSLPPTGDPTHNPGICPDQGSNR